MKRQTTLLVCQLLLVVTGCIHAQTKELKVPELNYERYSLLNGLEVILHQDKRIPIAAVDVRYHVGPRNERPGLTGFAHLFEHMMFQGSQHLGAKSHITYLEGAGAQGNGSTNFDHTAYYESFPSNYLDLAMWLESDRMGFLLDTLTQTKLDTQKAVVRNERRQNVENRPYGLVDEALISNMFPAGHPYRANVIGSHEDIESAELEDVRAFFKQYYTPNNATLVVAGDFDTAAVKKMIDKYFGPIPRGPELPSVAVSPWVIENEVKLSVTDSVQLPRVEIGWVSPSAYASGSYEGAEAAYLLGGDESSRFYRSLVYEQRLAQSVVCGIQAQSLQSMFTCKLTAAPGVSADQLLTTADAVIAKFRTEGPSALEVKRAKAYLLSNTISSLEYMLFLADQINSYNEYTRDPDYLRRDIKAQAGVTPEGVQKFVQSFLNADHRVVVLGIPGKKVVNDVLRLATETKTIPAVAAQYDTSFNASQSWRSTPPEPGPDPQVMLPKPNLTVLSNGLKVYVSEIHRLPWINMSFVALSGSSSDPQRLPGLADYTGSMLLQGANGKTAEQMSARAGLLGTAPEVSVDHDETVISTSGLSNQAEGLGALLADITRRPTFDSSEIDRIRAKRLTSLLQQKDSPREAGLSAVNHETYGIDSPYGHSIIGTPSSVKAVTTADISTYWNTHAFPAGAALVFAGDIDPETAVRLAKKYFGDWVQAGKTPPPPAPPTSPTRKIILIDKPGSPQSTMYLASFSAPRASTDYAGLQVVNGVLGGIFSSRINLNLREQHGYTYGARSTLNFRRGLGLWYTFSTVRTDATAPAVAEVYKELDRISVEPPTAVELTLVKDSIRRGFTSRFETVLGTSGQIKDIFQFGLPLDSLQRYPAQIASVTDADAARIAKRYIDPSHVFVVVVGDKSKVKDALTKLGLGTIEEWNTSAEPIEH